MKFRVSMANSLPSGVPMPFLRKFRQASCMPQMPIVEKWLSKWPR